MSVHSVGYEMNVFCTCKQHSDRIPDLQGVLSLHICCLIVLYFDCFGWYFLQWFVSGFFLQNAVNGSIQKVFCRALFIFDRPVFELFVLYRGLCGMSLSVVALNLSSSFSVQFLYFLLERYWMMAFSLYLISICLTFISQRPSITWVNLSFDLELNLPKLNLVSLQPQFHVESTFE